MAKKKIQRRWVIGSEYNVTGKAGRERRLKLVARTKIDRRETLLLQPVRKAKKQRKKTARRRRR